MEALEALGINGKLLIAQIVNFIILLLILRKFLYSPIVSMLENRKETIEKGLKDSEEAAKCLGEAEEKAREITQKAIKEASQILAEAKSESTKKADAILKQASEQADVVKNNAKIEADSIKENALKEAKKELGDVVILALDKIVGKELSDHNKEKLTRQAIKEL